MSTPNPIPPPVLSTNPPIFSSNPVALAIPMVPNAQVTPPVGGVFSRYQVQVDQGPGWPTNGDVLRIDVQRSVDGGMNWSPLSYFVLIAAPWKDSLGNVITSTLAADIELGTLDPLGNPAPVATAAADMFRMVLTPLQPCNPQIHFAMVP